MKHKNDHILELVCMDCVLVHLEHKKLLMNFLKEIADYNFQDNIWDIEAKELLEKIEADND